MTYKKLVSLKEMRIKRLIDEAEAAKQETKSIERQNLRN